MPGGEKKAVSVLFLRIAQPWGDIENPGDMRGILFALGKDIMKRM
ncbi:hypothetical protein KDA_46480 [Dictyobacter alpinus]|uniref:Uncharacterized protein n=1 Tax=Dictyobacter alpinus TaxID=2014873 RepID=A0A402BCV9_9CHLR|nr:hypothetical protein KDA_00140 [Dictyobacter alpinus]GCE29164.1 hypothetical protein KDA_46480 [Dictyobacter alpinus]